MTNDRIQAHLRLSALRNLEPLAIPPFTAFFAPDSNAQWNNYAIPDDSINQSSEGAITKSLAHLIEAFEKRNCLARFEYLADFAPLLSTILEANGFQAEIPTLLMICDSGNFQYESRVPGLMIHQLLGDDIESDLQAFVTVQRRAFGDDDAEPATVDEAMAFRQQYEANQLFLGRLHGEPVCTGTLQMPHQGVVELAGIGTLTAYRRQGIGTALTAHLVRAAIDQNMGVIYLTAADENAGRMYERVQFRPAGKSASYIVQSAYATLSP